MSTRAGMYDKRRSKCKTTLKTRLTDRGTVYQVHLPNKVHAACVAIVNERARANTSSLQKV